MSHLLVLIFQLLSMLLYMLCKTYDWPGISLPLLFSWLIPCLFYLQLGLRRLIGKNMNEAVVYLVFSILASDECFVIISAKGTAATTRPSL